jgi:hypothetical protein
MQLESCFPVAFIPKPEIFIYLAVILNFANNLTRYIGRVTAE